MLWSDAARVCRTSRLGCEEARSVPVEYRSWRPRLLAPSALPSRLRMLGLSSLLLLLAPAAALRLGASPQTPRAAVRLCEEPAEAEVIERRDRRSPPRK